MDAARAAWIGGTKLLRYGEVLPGGVAKGLAIMTQQGHLSSEHEQSGRRQLVLELGMGRGRLATQLFLSGATVIGVELAQERYYLAVSALERLVHRNPVKYEISKRTNTTFRVRQREGPVTICEIRLGNFFEVVTEEEFHAATLVFLQVCLPDASMSRVKQMLLSLQAGCRILAYENLRKIWKGGSESCPFANIGTPVLACSWAPKTGSRFFCFERAGRDCRSLRKIRKGSESDSDNDGGIQGKPPVDVEAAVRQSLHAHIHADQED